MFGDDDEFPISPSRAEKILGALANGEDPYTGALLPADHILNRPQVVRALLLATDAIHDHAASSRGSDDRRLTNAGTQWTNEEDGRLLSDYVAGRSVDELAAWHRRTPRAITSRLEKLAVIETEHDSSSTPTSSTKRKPGARTGKPWTREDDEALIAAFAAGTSMPDLADRLQLSSSSVEVRLVKLGLLPPHSDER
jgi:hypothetical protein